MSTDVEMATDELERPPIPAPRQDEPQPEPIDPKYLELLASLGFTEIPTAEQVKAKLDERRAEVRASVMEQADMRSWCDDGTRAVCANLRLPRPGTRSRHEVTVRFAFDATFRPHTFNADTARKWVEWFLEQDGTRGSVRRALGAEKVENFSILLVPAVGPAQTQEVQRD